MRSVRILAAAALLGGCVPDVSEAQQAAGTHRLTAERVAVYNLAGRVSIEAGTGDAVTVDVVTGGADAAGLEVATGDIDGREALRVLYPEDRIVYPAGENQHTELRVRDDGTFGGDDGGRARRRVSVNDDGNGLEAWADLTIRVPAGRDVAVHQAVGSVTVRNVDGRLLVDTHSAAVDVTGTRGSLVVDVGSGDVDVRDVEGQLVLDTGSGSVRLEGSAGDEALIDTGSGSVTATGVTARDLTIDTGSGDVTVEQVTADRLELDTGSGSVTVGLVSDVSNLTVDTGSGSVTIRAPADLGAQIEVETGSGGIETDFPMTLTRRSENGLSGTLGDGEGRIVIDTGSGDVRLIRQ